MKIYILPFIVSCFIVIVVSLFFLSIKNPFLENLQAKVKIAEGYNYVPYVSCDCMSVATGSIYVGYRNVCSSTFNMN